MIKLKVAEIIHPSFKGALIGLMGQEMSFDTAFKLKSLIKKVEKKILQSEEMKIELVKKYCPLDENGSPLPAKDEEGKDIVGSVRVPEEEEKEKEFKEKYFELMATEIEIDHPRIDPHSLRDTKVTISDLHFLEPCLKEIAEEPDLKLV